MLLTGRARVTSKELAAAAGVSPSTVSRVLNGVAHDMVSEETRARVIRLAAEMGYVPNAAARQLRTQRAQALGLLLPSIAHELAGNYPLLQQLAGIAEGFQSMGYNFVLCPALSGNEPMRLFRNAQIDGVLVMHPKEDEPCLVELHEAGVPIVVLNELPADCDLPWVDIDNVGGARQITEHLLQRGHRRIGHIYGRPGYVVTGLRMRGYCQALAGAGIGIDEDLLAVVPEPAQGPQGTEATRRLLALPDRPTAVFCHGDLLAHGALRAVEELGLRVPEDVAVVGFDDEPSSAYQRPALTTVRAPFREKGRVAARLLVELVEGRVLAERRVKLAAELVVRASS
ncbi:MAG: LacI family transcriptional regulator [Chloroflexi bacterium]|nr:LacI family transcriptional regulator [Chloroflexota bacterium]